MAYWTDLFTPDTYEAFSNSDRKVAGFRETQRSMADKVSPDDIFVCYMLRMSRWIGILQVIDGPFVDRTPRFVDQDDPFVVRFHVKPRVWLASEHTIPMRTEEVFSKLTFTRDTQPGEYWLGPLRRGLQRLDDQDGRFLETLLERQQRTPTAYALDAQAYQKWLRARIPRSDGFVNVSVPEDELDVAAIRPGNTSESMRIQASLCRLGEQMGFKIWLPANDRSRVCEHWTPMPGVLLERLPLNYDETTLKTIERIDVLWLKGRSIRRAFEIEHTTAIYSGLLRMADMCALLPNINVALHIVAPESRRDKVFEEITRPVFSLLEESPLSARCTYLSYDSVQEMAELPYLPHTSDSVLEEFVEHAE